MCRDADQQTRAKGFSYESRIQRIRTQMNTLSAGADCNVGSIVDQDFHLSILHEQHHAFS